jgi:competence protein ComEC
VALAAPHAQGEMKIHAINVGQGAATLLEFPCGAALVDTGGEANTEDAIVGYLDAFFARRTDLQRTIDVLFVTHPHIDHALNAQAIVDHYRVKNVVTDGLEHGSGGAQQKSLQDWATHQGVPLREVSVNDLPSGHGLTDAVIDPLDCGGGDPKLQLLWGDVPDQPTNWTAKAFANLNNHSVVLRVDFGQSSALITGDLELDALADLIAQWQPSGLLDVDVYEAGHHGSKNGTTQELLSAVTPKVTVIGVGTPKKHGTFTTWAYGHPNRGVVEMCENATTMARDVPKPVQVGIKAKTFQTITVDKAVYATGWDGNVVITAGADGHLGVATDQ